MNISNINLFACKYYACTYCQKFKPKSDNEKICRLCDHHFNFHEQVSVFLMAFILGYNNICIKKYII